MSPTIAEIQRVLVIGGDGHGNVVDVVGNMIVYGDESDSGAAKVAMVDKYGTHRKWIDAKGVEHERSVIVRVVDLRSAGDQARSSGQDALLSGLLMGLAAGEPVAEAVSEIVAR